MSDANNAPPLGAYPPSFLERTITPSKPAKGHSAESVASLLSTSLLRIRSMQRASSTQDSYLRTLDTEFEPMVLPAFLSAFRRRRNAVSRWCRLPPEILCLVFQAVKNICEWPAVIYPAENGDHENDVEIASYDPGWVAVAQVCSYWREVVLSAPWLWSDPENCFAIPPRMVPLILQQSRNSPLRLEFVDHCRLTPVDAEERLSQWFSPSTYPRLRHLSMFHVSSEILTVITPYLQKTMADLRVLHLMSDDANAEHACLPLELCLHPSLVDVALYDCTPSSWNSPVFCSRITRLELVLTREVSRDLLPSPTQLAEVIASIALLEELSLQNIFPDATTSDDYPSITFPASLTSLDVRATADARLHAECLLFLGHIFLRHDLRLQVQVYDQDGTSIKSFAPSAVQRIYEQQSSPHELIIGVESFLTHNSELHTPDRPISTSYYMFQDVSAATSIISFAMESLCLSCTDIAVVLPLLRFPLHNVRAISFEPHGADNIQTGKVWWHELCVRARDVRRVGVYIESCTALLNALSESRLADGIVSFTMFPQLEVIHIHAEDPDSVDESDDDKQQDCAATLGALRIMICERVRHDSSLRVLLVDANLSHWPIWKDIPSAVAVKFIDFMAFLNAPLPP